MQLPTPKTFAVDAYIDKSLGVPTSPNEISSDRVHRHTSFDTWTLLDVMYMSSAHSGNGGAMRRAVHGATAPNLKGGEGEIRGRAVVSSIGMPLTRSWVCYLALEPASASPPKHAPCHNLSCFEARCLVQPSAAAEGAGDGHEERMATACG